MWNTIKHMLVRYHRRMTTPASEEHEQLAMRVSSIEHRLNAEERYTRMWRLIEGYGG